jgi:hypothetical protein
MTSPPPKSIRVELTVSAEQPELLEGLELWLQLGLISDRQVQNISRSYLTCPLSQTATARQPDFIAADRSPEPTRRHNQSPVRPTVPAAPPRPAAPPSWATQVLTSLMAELSVIWLLFLGVFMVVVSSAVLAASQWQNFSALGQYSILWAYTLAFGGAGLWASQRANLRLTGRMLEATTLLIIPVNFWMIDGFNLWRSPLAWGIGLIAALSLVAMMVKLLQHSARRDVVNTIGLSILQWGWAIPGLPLVATYIGTVGTALLQLRRHPIHSPSSPVSTAARALPDIGKIAIAFSTLLLIARATLAKGIPLSQLGLAVGLCGWILCWDNRQQQRRLLSQIGAGLLVMGWLVTVTDQLWQAIGISFLILWLLAERLQRLWLVQDTVAIILVGLQTYTLFRVLFPPTLRQSAMALIAQWANLQQGAWELTGLGFFTYIIIILLFAVYLRRQQQPKLALLSEQMALGLGTILLVPSTINPFVRAIYLSLSAVTLGIVLWRKSALSGSQPWLIYLTHTTGLVAVIAWIAWGWPNLPNRSWAAILLLSMTLEWIWCWFNQNRPWQLSSWYLGLGLAACSYPLWETSVWNLAWLITPSLLIGLARRETFPYPRQAGWLSVTALLLTPILTSWSTLSLLISLVIATVLMAMNTKQLQHLLAAASTVGFGVATIATTAEQIWQPFPSVWITVGVAAILWGLWLLRHVCSRYASPLAALYTQALNGWAVALTFGNLLSLTAIASSAMLYNTLLSWPHALAIGLTTGAIAYRTVQQPTNMSLIGLAWGAELLAMSGVHLTGGSWDDLAVANLALGLGTQMLGDRGWQQSPLLSRQIIPLGYAVFGLGCAHTQFTATTGLFTLAAAVIVIGVGRRQSEFKALTYVGITGISIAAYELLIHQMTRSSGGAAGDGLTLMAGLAAVIAIVYQVLHRWLAPYWRISTSAMQAVSHIHWGIGSCIAAAALTFPISNSGSLLWMTITALLAAYAIWAGRQQSEWVYLGLVEGLAVLGYGLHRSLPESTLALWGAAIACLVAFLLYQFPWQRLGWAKSPGQNVAQILPGCIVLLTSDRVGIASLLITGGFYAWLALRTQQIRFTYLSLGLANWAVLRIFQQVGFTDPLWFVTVWSGSMLYAVQVDPALQPDDRKATRHLLRSLAVGLFCLTALYQSDRNWLQGLLTIGCSLGLIAAGLTLRVRAYLYVGTLTFMAKVLLQLWAFISDYSLLLWALGILLGLGLIWIAATFEARRSQTIALLQYWITELDRWE